MKRVFFLQIALALVSPVFSQIESGTFIDNRDGQKYKWVIIGNQYWMAENLKYLPSVSPCRINLSAIVLSPRYFVPSYQGNSVSDVKATNNYATYGVLYNWAAANTACPNGWHLPTDGEWRTLEDYLDYDGGKIKEVGTSHWVSPNEGASNLYGFRALPGGTISNSGLGYTAYFWSSTTSREELYAWARYLEYNDVSIARVKGPKDWGYSVRCVKDY